MKQGRLSFLILSFCALATCKGCDDKIFSLVKRIRGQQERIAKALSRMESIVVVESGAGNGSTELLKDPMALRSSSAALGLFEAQKRWLDRARADAQDIITGKGSIRSDFSSEEGRASKVLMSTMMAVERQVGEIGGGYHRLADDLDTKVLPSLKSIKESAKDALLAARLLREPLSSVVKAVGSMNTMANLILVILLFSFACLFVPSACGCCAKVVKKYER